MKLRKFTNNKKTELILELKKKYKTDKKPLWLDIAKRINKPSRQKICVNLMKINKYAKENDTVIVAGKILGAGNLEKKLVLSSLEISQNALNKINESKSKYIGFKELMNMKNIKNVKIMQ